MDKIIDEILSTTDGELGGIYSIGKGSLNLTRVIGLRVCAASTFRCFRAV